jgi:hypothetical protein
MYLGRYKTKNLFSRLVGRDDDVTYMKNYEKRIGEARQNLMVLSFHCVHASSV